MQEYFAGYYSQRGERHRVNQDSICLRSVGGEEGEALVAAVFDGMGGLSEGERISGASAKELSAWVDSHRNLLLSGEEQDLCDSLRLTLDILNERIRSYCKKKGTEAGSTAVVLLLRRNRYLCCNVGDSRAYRLTGREAEQISEDHSLAADLVSAGLLRAEEAGSFAQRNVLTQALGTLEKIKPSFRAGDCALEDAFLLCGDGFYQTLTERELRDLSAADSGAEEAAAALRKAAETAVSRGETDDITGILLISKK